MSTIPEPINAIKSIRVILLGSVICFKDLQSSNVAKAITFVPCGNTTVSKFTHFEKVPPELSTIPFLKITDFNEVQFAKHLNPNELTLGQIIFFRLEHP